MNEDLFFDKLVNDPHSQRVDLVSLEKISTYSFQITETCFGLIGPHQSDAEILSTKKISNAMVETNSGPMGERPVFYHYTNDFPFRQ